MIGALRARWQRFVWIPGTVEVTEGRPRASRKHRFKGNVQFVISHPEDSPSVWVDYNTFWWPSFRRLPRCDCGS